MQLRVFKFGGASVKNADAVRNVADILKRYPGQSLIVVVSAMGKTTNALERLAKAYFYGNEPTEAPLEEVVSFHDQILSELFTDKDHPAYSTFFTAVDNLKSILKQSPGSNFDFEYDQIVCFGELFSSSILCHYLNDNEIPCKWFDVREMIITDKTYREAKVNWEKTSKRINEKMGSFFNTPLFPQLAVTQGFIASATDKSTTTLGREGSDYSAAIFACSLNASDVIIWKDVPGLFNADPNYYKNTLRIEKMSYKESLELSYYGVGVIHPNTIKPLQNKGISLYVKSFNDPGADGTIIGNVDDNQPPLPCYIHKDGQWLLSISPRDFSYITEPALHIIFGILSSLGIKVNLMQNSAISFSVCIDDPALKKEKLINHLKKEFKVRYNENLRLITIRNYNSEIIDQLVGDKEVILEQKSRYTMQVVVKQPDN